MLRSFDRTWSNSRTTGSLSLQSRHRLLRRRSSTWALARWRRAATDFLACRWCSSPRSAKYARKQIRHQCCRPSLLRLNASSGNCRPHRPQRFSEEITNICSHRNRTRPSWSPTSWPSTRSTRRSCPAARARRRSPRAWPAGRARRAGGRGARGHAGAADAWSSARAGAGGGRTLLLCGHLDTVAVDGHGATRTSRASTGDRLYGRGAYDMKAGLAAALIACREAAAPGPGRGRRRRRGGRRGAREPRRAGGARERPRRRRRGHRADRARGRRRAQGLRVVRDRGRRARRARLAPAPRRRRDRQGRPGPHRPRRPRHRARRARPTRCSAAGRSTRRRSAAARSSRATPPAARSGSSAARCPARRPAAVEDELARAARPLPRAATRSSRSSQRTLLVREPFEIDPEARDRRRRVRRRGRGDRRPPAVGGASYWADAAFIAAAGIPTVMFGPAGEGAHAAEEWVSLVLGRDRGADARRAGRAGLRMSSLVNPACDPGACPAPSSRGARVPRGPARATRRRRCTSSPRRVRRQGRVRAPRAARVQDPRRLVGDRARPARGPARPRARRRERRQPRPRRRPRGRAPRAGLPRPSARARSARRGARRSPARAPRSWSSTAPTRTPSPGRGRGRDGRHGADRRRRRVRARHAG